MRDDYTILEDFGAVRVVCGQNPMTRTPHQCVYAVAVPGIQAEFSGASITIPPIEHFDDLEVLHHFASRLPTKAENASTVLLFTMLGLISNNRLGGFTYFETDGAFADNLYQHVIMFRPQAIEVTDLEGHKITIADYGQGTFRGEHYALQLAIRNLRYFGFNPYPMGLDTVYYENTNVCVPNI